MHISAGVAATGALAPLPREVCNAQWVSGVFRDTACEPGQPTFGVCSVSAVLAGVAAVLTDLPRVCT